MINMIIEYEFWCVTVVFNLIVGIVNHESCFCCTLQETKHDSLYGYSS